MKRLIVILALAGLIAAPALQATSVSTTKISRLAVSANGMVTLTTAATPGAGCRTSSTEFYFFDGSTDRGRATLMTALVAYSTQGLVTISGSGACSTINTFLVEGVNSLTVF